MHTASPVAMKEIDSNNMAGGGPAMTRLVASVVLLAHSCDVEIPGNRARPHPSARAKRRAPK